MLNHIYSDQIIKLYQHTKYLQFEFGDKPQKLFARQLRKLDGEKTIHKIRSDTGETLTLPKDTNDRFLQYYQTLSSTKTTECPARMETFLQKCNLTGLDLKERELLGAEI